MDNLTNLLPSPKTQQHLASRIIENSTTKKTTLQIQSTPLSTLGKPFPLISPPVKKQLFSTENMCMIRRDLNLSTRQSLVRTTRRKLTSL